MEDSIKKLFDVDPKKIPSSIPLFPLENVLLLPFGKLPLNIFEERYINMVLDSLKSHRMIGIIQPKNNNNDFFTASKVKIVPLFPNTFRIATLYAFIACKGPTTIRSLK